MQLARARYDLTPRRAAVTNVAKLRPPRLDAAPQQRTHEVAARRSLRVDDEDGRPLLEHLGGAGAERCCEVRSDEAVAEISRRSAARPPMCGSGAARSRTSHSAVSRCR